MKVGTETAAGGAPASFSATELAALRERREKLEAQWVTTARKEMTASEGGGLNAEVSPEAQEAIGRIQAELRVVDASVKRAEDAEAQHNLVKAEEELTRKAPRWKDRVAKASQDFTRDLKLMAKGEYRSADPNDLGNGLALPQPLIARNPHTGKQEVHPFPAVFPGDGEASVEASFRMAEIIAADRFGAYDPVTGQATGNHLTPVGREKVEAELSYSGLDTAGVDWLTQGGMLHLYEIQQNELGMYMDVKQVPNINPLLVDRRTGVGTPAAGGLVAEDGTIPNLDSTFDTLTFTPRKYAFLKGMTRELAMTMEPWQMSAVIVMDGGIALGNAIGAHVVTGSGTGPGGTSMAAQWQGLLTWAKVAGNANNFAGVSQADFLPSPTTATSFGIDSMSRYMASVPKEYFRKPGKLISMPLAIWARFSGATDGERRKLFNTTQSLNELAIPQFNTRCILDENWDDASTAGEIPMFYGDFGSACLINYGAVRVEFSKEHGYDQDRLYWKFVAHRGFGVVDPNGIRGYRIT